MAKAKKGKQKQETTASVPAQAPPIAPQASYEEPQVFHDEGAGMTEMGHHGFSADPPSARAGASPTVWPMASPAIGRGTNVHPGPSPQPPPKTAIAKEQKLSTASKSVGWAKEWDGDNDTGWGGGAAHNWGARSPGDQEEYEDGDSEEWEEGSEDGWGATTHASAWGAQPTSTSRPTQPSWKSWGQEAQRMSKTPSIVANAPVASTNRPALSNQQQSQILSSLLNQPSSQNGYLAAAQQQQKLKQQQPALNPYYQKSVPQPKQTVGAFAAAAPASPWASLSKNDHKSQKEPPKHQRSQSETRDPWASGFAGWGAASTGGWDNRQSAAWGNETSNRGKDAAPPGQNTAGWGQNADPWSADTGGWGKASVGLDKDAGNWGKGSVGWDKDGGDWGKSPGGNWGRSSGGLENDTGKWTTVSGWGPIPEEDEESYEEDDRRVHFNPKAGGGAWGTESLSFASSFKGSEPPRSIANLWASEKPKDTTYTMPSKTLAYASSGTTTSLNTGLPRNKINEYTNVQFHDSQGVALQFAHHALFGRARKAKDRIHWSFPSNKDERVESLMTWITTVSYSLGTYGLHRFLQSRERGALIANADYQIPGGKNEPAFDWLTFDQLQETRDKIMQESAAFYDPAAQTIVFVFLPSKSGNSVAMWRRKINVPNNMRLMLQGEIALAMAALRREEDYVVHVDEYPQPEPLPVQKRSGSRRLRRSSLPSRTEYPGAYPMIIEETGKPKKKRKWWHFFRGDW